MDRTCSLSSCRTCRDPRAPVVANHSTGWICKDRCVGGWQRSDGFTIYDAVMKLARSVQGATGGTGKQVAWKALANGHTVVDGRAQARGRCRQRTPTASFAKGDVARTRVDRAGAPRVRCGDLGVRAGEQQAARFAEVRPHHEHRARSACTEVGVAELVFEEHGADDARRRERQLRWLPARSASRSCFASRTARCARRASGSQRRLLREVKARVRDQRGRAITPHGPAKGGYKTGVARYASRRRRRRSTTPTSPSS